jgi:hypothetical protein
MKKYYVRIPYWAGPLVVLAVNEKEAIERFKREQGFGRVPRGYGIWEIKL